MVEIDCLDVVRLLSFGAPPQGASSLVRHIFELCKREWDVSFHHVLRSSNRVADCLARSVAWEDFTTRLFRVPSAPVSQILYVDGSLLS
ncbi:hypothetical protein V6N12_049818 [Hibiscus sabdariffa]|uniref:RNase H type-1 domain-containing protein n=1 Tax=Hibiscus sabdariffa TaxID=183260 RepID=A0ABR2GAM1_9ROSI